MNPILRFFSLYAELSKSGIVALVLISVMGGYLAGHPFEKPFSFLNFLITLAGVLFLASGSSALNQLQEQKIDLKMNRTSKRPLPSGRMSQREAIIFILISIPLGLGLLLQLQAPVYWLGLLALISYNGLYTLWWKKHQPFAAIPGALPGALPILMGYAAASESLFSPGGCYLFFILYFWQMPHFWVLALKYSEDYSKGGIPTLPVAHGSAITVKHIILWCLAYVGIALLAPLFLQVGKFYIISALIISAKLLWELWIFAKVQKIKTLSIEPTPSRSWLRFFLWVNFSLILYIAAVVIDLWSVYADVIWIRHFSSG